MFLDLEEIVKRDKSYELGLLSMHRHVRKMIFDVYASMSENQPNRSAHIRHQYMKTTVLSSHRCLINTGDPKMDHIEK